MALLDGLIWVEQMNYPAFDFPTDVSHETYHPPPPPPYCPFLLQSFFFFFWPKKYNNKNIKEEEEREAKPLSLKLEEKRSFATKKKKICKN